MLPIIPSTEPDLLEAELTPDKLLRTTNFANRKIYSITHHSAPNVMRELGRLREMSFRMGGGGTGNEMDIDEYDTDPECPFKQLVVWCPEDKAIVGGYRYLEGSKIGRFADGRLKSPTAELFEFSEEFIEKYLPNLVELGRSFVQPAYQFTGAEGGRKGLYSLDNLWDGLGAILINKPDILYYFGKVTMYPRFNATARDLILHFMRLYFPDDKNLMRPLFPIKMQTPNEVLQAAFKGNAYKEDYRALTQKLKEYGELLPPLINAYMNLSPTMRSFGTSINEHFGNVEETGILITLADVYEAKKTRHITIG